MAAVALVQSGPVSRIQGWALKRKASLSGDSGKREGSRDSSAEYWAMCYRRNAQKDQRHRMNESGHAVSAMYYSSSHKRRRGSWFEDGCKNGV